MDILFAATELSPMAKVGGLGDVTAALTKALRQLGNKVTLVLPRLPALEQSGLLVARRLTPLTFDLGGTPHEVTVYDGRLGSGVELVLLDAPNLFDRTGIYGEDGLDYPDNCSRFAVFCRAIVELVSQREASGSPFDVVHAHDWPTALVAVYLRERARSGAGPRTPSVLTIHNLAHQGICSRDVLPSLGLPWDAFTPEFLEYYGNVNVLKGGLLAAQKVTTVSASYAQEIRTEALGCGLSGVIRSRKDEVTGITNGIDYAVWNPAADPALPARFDAEDTSSKERCRTAIVRELGLDLVVGAPLVIHVGRMTHQKGADLCADIAAKVVFAGAHLVLVGDGDPGLMDRVSSAMARLEGRATFVRAASEAMVHRLFAGADLVLVPSRFEPCGLVQMYAQRYGALPVVHAVGGLRDTVVDCPPTLETGTGFVFQEASAQALLGATQRGLAAYAHPDWATLRRRVMRLDVGWDRPARRYEKLYRAAIADMR